MDFLPDEVSLIVEETGDPNYPFGVYTVSSQGYVYRCVAQFEYNDDAILFINAVLKEKTTDNTKQQTT